MIDIFFYKNNSSDLKRLYDILYVKYNILEKNIYRDKLGKPEVYGNEFNISLSYSYPYCLFGISKSKLGIDLEENKVDYPQAILKLFSKEERDFILSTPNIAHTNFYYIWCSKEAYGKYLGTGLRYNLNDLNIISNSNLANIVNVENDKEVYFHYFTLLNQVVVICSEMRCNLNIIKV